MKTPAFEDLQELLHFVTKARPKSAKIFSDWTETKAMPKYAQLFHRAVSDTSGNEHEVAQALGFELRDGAYKKLRSDLIERMENMLFFLDLRLAGHSALSQAYMASDRHVFIVKRIINLGGRKLGTRLCHRWIGLAVEYERWSNASQLAMCLRQAASLEGKKSEYRKYAEDYRRYVAIFTAEQNAQMISESVEIHFARDAKDKPELAAPLREQLAQVEADRDTYTTFGLSLAAIELKAMLAQIEKNSLAALQVCKEADHLFGAWPRFSHRFLQFRWAVKRLECACELGDRKEVHQAIALCESFDMSGENNWFAYKEVAVRGALKIGELARAESALLATLSHPRFGLQSAALRRRLGALRGEIVKARAKAKKKRKVSKRKSAKSRK